MFNKKVVFALGLAVGSAFGAGLWYRYIHQPEQNFLTKVGVTKPKTFKDFATQDLSKAGHLAQEQFVDWQAKGLKSVEKGRERAFEMLDHARANIVETMDHELEAIAERWPGE